jgi:hypothetical protein
MSKARPTAWLAALLCVLAGLAILNGCAASLNSSSKQGEKCATKVTLCSWHELLVELDSTTSNPVELRAASLPWEWRYSMWVKAFERDAVGSPLDECLTVADLSATNDRVSLLPGKPLQGKIDLRNRFPELENVLRQHDVIIFWSYAPELANGDIEPRLSGSLVIPRF